MKIKKDDQKSKLLISGIITSSAVLLGLYVNNGNVVKADSLTSGQDATQTSSGSINGLDSSAENGQTSSSSNDIDTGSGNSTNQNENSLSGNSGSTTGSITSGDRESQTTTDQKKIATRDTLKRYNWGGLEITLSDDGVLTIPGGTAIFDGSVNNRCSIRELYFENGQNWRNGQNLVDNTKKIEITGNLKIVGPADSLFAYLRNVTEISGLDKLDTSEVTSMRRMFYLCNGLTKIDVSSFDTHNVTNMSEMFNMPQAWKSNLNEIKGINSDKFNTSNVTDMSQMFLGCWLLKDLDVSKFKTSNVTDMSYMFCQCVNVPKLDVSKFITSNVTDMSGMFFACAGLTELDLGNFDMTKVIENGDWSSKNRGMLSGMHNLLVLVLGPNVKLRYSSLINPVDAHNDAIDHPDWNRRVSRCALPYKSRWINLAGGSFEYPKGINDWSARDMQLNYNGSHDADTYYRYGDVRSQYYDEDGNRIAPDEVVMNIIGKSYVAVEKKEIPGYTYKETESDSDAATGVLGDEEKVITYIYTKNASNPVAPSVKAKVTAHYQDENGNQIASDEVLTGKVGDGYQTKQKTIAGYTFKEVRGNATGFFTANEQTVTYVYTKDDNETATTLPVKPEIKPKKHHKQVIEKQRKSTPLPNRTPSKANPQLPQTGAKQESNGILAALGSMMVLISSISGAWFKRKQK